MKRISLYAALLAAASFTGHAFAQDVQAGPQWGLGIGASVERKVYRDIENENRALPVLFYEGQWVSVAGGRVDLKIPASSSLSFRLRARYSNDGYEAGDSPWLAGMAERKEGMWLGGAAVWQRRAWNVSAEATSATGDAEGKRFRLEGSHSFNSGKLRFTPRIAANWYDGDYVNYYYGVRAAEVRAGRALYTPGSGSSAEVGLRAAYALGAHHDVFLDLSATRYSSTIKDSPLVDGATGSAIRLGYLYRF